MLDDPHQLRHYWRRLRDFHIRQPTPGLLRGLVSCRILIACGSACERRAAPAERVAKGEPLILSLLPVLMFHVLYEYAPGHFDLFELDFAFVFVYIWVKIYLYLVYL